MLGATVVLLIYGRAPSANTDNIITEDDDDVITEDGDFIIEE